MAAGDGKGLDQGGADFFSQPGEFRLLVGTSSEDLPLEGTVTITGDVRVVPEGHVLTTPVRVG